MPLNKETETIYKNRRSADTESDQVLTEINGNELRQV